MLSIYLEPAQSQEVSNFSVGGKGLMKSLFLLQRRLSFKIKVWNNFFLKKKSWQEWAGPEVD